MIRLDNNISLTPFYWSDLDALQEHLSCKDIYDTTITIPHPYTLDDAGKWINFTKEKAAKISSDVIFAIRDNKRKQCIGSIGFDNFTIGDKWEHTAQLGYWLAKSYWGKGITTMATKALCSYMFEIFGKLKRIEANVFYHNIASARVLEKSGFTLEGVRKNHYCKDGKIFDGKVYGLVRM